MKDMAFLNTTAIRTTILPSSSLLSKQLCKICDRHCTHAVVSVPTKRPLSMTLSNADEQESIREEKARIESMRSRLQGLFGSDEDNDVAMTEKNFDGLALRQAIVDRWGVQYDIQPTKFAGRVYVQIMWRYFEQQSFYMDEDEFACHCEAMAILLKRWNAVDYFLDYISNIKKKPVVGITINIPIPGLQAKQTQFEITEISN